MTRLSSPSAAHERAGHLWLGVGPAQWPCFNNSTYSKHTPSLEAPARPASLPSASADPNVIVADALAIQRDEDDAADQAATLSGLGHASAMLVQLDKVDKVVEARARASKWRV